jgi:hypothetical protein
MSKRSTMKYLYDRHPYIDARKAFLADHITIEQAAAMIAADREWIAECELTGLKPYATALQVVRDVWRADLVKAIQTRKRQAALCLQAAQQQQHT